MTTTRQRPTNAAAEDRELRTARQCLYRFCAISLLDPRMGSWEILRDLANGPLLQEAAAFIRAQPACAAAELGPAERPLADLDPSRVFARLPDAAEKLNKEYEQTFGLLVSNACPPYETEYIDAKLSFQRSQTLADVSGFFSAFGLKPSSRLPERHDHIVLELEFMAFLLDAWKRADDEQNQEQSNVCADAASRFMEDHLSRWAPIFAKLLEREQRDDFYHGLGAFLGAFMTAERSLLGLEPLKKLSKPTALERPEECEGC
ncbi:MAG: molecular chaperone TorD family protein, partial [Planctomycetales bacterium]